MPRFEEMFPSKFLKAEDLKGKDGRGWREFTLTIDGVSLEDMGGEDGDKKWVVSFKGADKGLVLNKTNGQALNDAYGPETDEWVGQKVILFVMTVNSPQGPRPGIRLRVPAADSFDPDKVPA